MDVTGVFGYSDEDGTEAAGFADDLKLDEDEIRARTEHVTALVEELNAQRAEERIGEEVVVLVESIDEDGIVGRAAHQGPEVDGTTTLRRRGRRADRRPADRDRVRDRRRRPRRAGGRGAA